MRGPEPGAEVSWDTADAGGWWAGCKDDVTSDDARIVGRGVLEDPGPHSSDVESVFDVGPGPKKALGELDIGAAGKDTVC